MFMCCRLSTACRVLEKCVLPEFEKPDRNVWPPRSTFASDFVQSMGVPLHAGPGWSDPQVQERRRAELASEQQRLAAHHAQAAKAQELRINREEKERFLAQQRS